MKTRTKVLQPIQAILIFLAILTVGNGWGQNKNTRNQFTTNTDVDFCFTIYHDSETRIYTGPNGTTPAQGMSIAEAQMQAMDFAQRIVEDDTEDQEERSGCVFEVVSVDYASIGYEPALDRYYYLFKVVTSETCCHSDDVPGEHIPTGH